MRERNIVFPILVRDREDKEYLQVFHSVEDAQLGLEPVDIQNHEYDAWDLEGFRLSLTVSDVEQSGQWLRIGIVGSSPSIGTREVRCLLLQFARSRKLEPSNELQGDLFEFVKWIEQETERKSRAND
jgi:hypothetical protein